MAVSEVAEPIEVCWTAGWNTNMCHVRVCWEVMATYGIIWPKAYFRSYISRYLTYSFLFLMQFVFVIVSCTSHLKQETGRQPYSLTDNVHHLYSHQDGNFKHTNQKSSMSKFSENLLMSKFSWIRRGFLLQKKAKPRETSLILKAPGRWRKWRIRSARNVLHGSKWTWRRRPFPFPLLFCTLIFGRLV